METEPLALALSFISEQPHAAAKTLEQQPLEQAAIFVQEIPLSYQSLLIRHLQPVYAARLLTVLGDNADLVAAIVDSLDVSVLTRILRLMHHTDTTGILRNLRSLKRNACESMLHYPDHAVGAWMQPDVAQVCTDMSVSDARTYLENTYDGSEAGFIVVTDRDGRLEGRMTWMALLQANPVQGIHELMVVDPPWMSPNFLLAQAVRSWLWDKNDMVVITDREQKVLGLLRHADLRLGLSHHHQRQVPASADSEDLAASLLSTYSSSLYVLFNTVMDVVETDLKS